MLRTERVDALPTVLADRYEIGHAVGSGGVAIVFRAHDRKHDRPVAIKVLRPELASSITVDRFLREIRFAAQLQHPNILPLHDSGEIDGLPFYVMPLIEGETLRDRLTREKHLPIADAVRLVREAADALQFAHERGIVHRDIKPENLLLSAGHVLVADFGIARAISKADGGKLTDTGIAIGTPSYMSPEQAFTGDVDARSDVYSLGCVLHELLAGEPPFGGVNAMAVLARHSAGALPSMRGVRPSIPQALEAVVTRALETDPTDRFQSAGAMSEALAQVSLRDGIARPSAAAPDLGHESARRPRRHRFTAFSAAGLVVVAAASTLVWTQRHGNGERQPGGPDPRTIAILYFNPAGSDSLRYVADALTEMLIRRLGSADSLHVISTNGVRPFRTRSMDTKPVGADSVARALDAGLVLRGTVSSVGQTLRLDMALVDGTSGKTITSDSVQRPRDEIFGLENDAALRLSTLLQRRLGQEIRARAPERETKSLRAWTLYHQADALNRDAEDDLSPRGIEASSRKRRLADSLWSLAALEDPAWAAPIVERATLAFRQVLLTGQREPSRIPLLLDSGLALANQALSRSPDDAEALEMRGTLRLFRWLYRVEPPSAWPQLRAAAEADFRASIAANPRRASAWAGLSFLFSGSGRERPAEAAARHAYALDPYGPAADKNLWRAFMASLGQKDVDDAKRLCAVFERRFPSNFRSRECRLWLYGLNGQKPNVAEMWTAYRALLSGSPPSVHEFSALRGQMLVALGLARAGFADSARHVAIRARGDTAIDPARVLVLYEAHVRTALGDKDEAFRLLQEYARAAPQAFEDEGDDPWFEDLWSDPRWQALRAVKR